jgi:hypothetical protein
MSARRPARRDLRKFAHPGGGLRARCGSSCTARLRSFTDGGREPRRHAGPQGADDVAIRGNGRRATGATPSHPRGPSLSVQPEQRTRLCSWVVEEPPARFRRRRRERAASQAPPRGWERFRRSWNGCDAIRSVDADAVGRGRSPSRRSDLRRGDRRRHARGERGRSRFGVPARPATVPAGKPVLLRGLRGEKRQAALPAGDGGGDLHQRERRLSPGRSHRRHRLRRRLLVLGDGSGRQHLRPTDRQCPNVR